MQRIAIDSGRSGIGSTARTHLLLIIKWSFRKIHFENNNIETQSSFTTVITEEAFPLKPQRMDAGITADRGCWPSFTEQTAWPESIGNNLSPHCDSTLLAYTASLPTGHSTVPFTMRQGQNTTTSGYCLHCTEVQGRARSYTNVAAFVHAVNLQRY